MDLWRNLGRKTKKKKREKYQTRSLKESREKSMRKFRKESQRIPEGIVDGNTGDTLYEIPKGIPRRIKESWVKSMEFFPREISVEFPEGILGEIPEKVLGNP